MGHKQRASGWSAIARPYKLLNSLLLWLFLVWLVALLAGAAAWLSAALALQVGHPRWHAHSHTVRMMLHRPASAHTHTQNVMRCVCRAATAC